MKLWGRKKAKEQAKVEAKAKKDEAYKSSTIDLAKLLDTSSWDDEEREIGNADLARRMGVGSSSRYGKSSLHDYYNQIDQLRD